MPDKCLDCPVPSADMDGFIVSGPGGAPRSESAGVSSSEGPFAKEAPQTGHFILKGKVSSSSPLPDAPQVGWAYIAGDAGEYGGVQATKGDMVYCMSLSPVKWGVLQADSDDSGRDLVSVSAAFGCDPSPVLSLTSTAASGEEAVQEVDMSCLSTDWKLTAAGSTTGRTLPDRFADVVNVKDFGAKGDGVADDTAAIASAVSAASVKNASVFFPAGTYKTLSAVDDFLNVECRGDGVISAGNNSFYATNKPGHTNKFFVSTSGGGDGLALDRPATISQVASFLNGKVLEGTWLVNVAAGTYEEQPSFEDITLSASNALIIRGEAPTGSIDQITKTDGRAWGTKFAFPQNATRNWALRGYNVTDIRVEYIEFDATNGVFDGTDSSCVQFAKCGDVRFYDNKIKKIQDYGLDCHNDRRVFFGGCTFLGEKEAVTVGGTTTYVYKGSGVYIYGGYASSLSSIYREKRNRFVELESGVLARGQAYIHCDYNDFDDCKNATRAQHFSYIGANYCSQKNCIKTTLAQSSTIHINTKEEFDGSNTARLFLEGNLGINKRADGSNDGEYELWKQGFYFPDRGNNGSRAYGFNDSYSTSPAAVWNLTTADAGNSIKAGDPPSRLSNIDFSGIALCSKNTNAWLSFLTNFSTKFAGLRFLDDASIYDLASLRYSQGLFDFVYNDQILLRISPTNGVVLGSSPDSDDDSKKAATTEWVLDRIEALGDVFSFKGIVADAASLPSSGNELGDAYAIEDTGTVSVWGGAAWADLGPWDGVPSASNTQIDALFAA